MEQDYDRIINAEADTQSGYYIWLETLVDDGDHSMLIRYLYEKAFRWQFTLDENRAAGGINLRSRFAYENSVDVEDVGGGPCSILEMLVALADRMTEILPYDIFDCFWIIVSNLGLDRFSNDNFNDHELDYILKNWLDRKYDAHGRGSIFPLQKYNGDCRTLDIWSQMNAWISENYPHTDDWLSE